MIEMAKRRIKMRREVGSFFTLLSLFLCLIVANKCSGQVERKFHFRIDNSKPQLFGFDCPEEGGEGVGPCSISIHDSLGFIVDSYFRNVKEVNLINGRVVAVSDSNERGGFVDVTVFEDRVLISCYQNLLYVYSVSLRKLDSVVVGQPGEWKEGATWWPASGHFYWSGDSLFLHCNEGQVYWVSSAGHQVKLVESKIPTNLVGREPSAHGKKYTVERGAEGYVLHAGKHSAKMKNDLSKMVNCYDATNLDFDSLRVAFFGISPNELTLYVYDYSRR